VRLKRANNCYKVPIGKSNIDILLVPYNQAEKIMYKEDRYALIVMTKRLTCRRFFNLFHQTPMGR